MSWKSIVITGLLCVLASPVLAVPKIRAITDGLSGANQKWKIQVQPDVNVLWNNPDLAGAEGASLAAELDLTFSTAVISATAGAGLPDLNNGNNPFTAGITDGIVTSGNTVFAAVGGPASASALFKPFPGDANKDNAVTLGDFGLLSANWDPAMAHPGKTRSQADFTGDGFVTLGDFGLLSGNWLKEFWIDAVNVTTTGAGGTVSWGGHTAAGVATAVIAQGGQSFPGLAGGFPGAGGGSVSGGAVPEPASLALLFLGSIGCCLYRKRSV
jgi:PEP-CTERM motif